MSYQDPHPVNYAEETMRPKLIRVLAGIVMACGTFTANAADELIVYAFKDGNPATGLVVKLDGGVERQLGEDGSVFFNLKPGGHVVAILDKGKVLSSARFDTAQGQYADVSFSLKWETEPQVSVETYLRTESPAERSAAPNGSVLGRVTYGGESLAGATLSIAGTNYVTKTDTNGNYKLVLPRGEYDLSISHPEAGEERVSNLRVVASIERGANFRIAGKPAESVLGSFQIERPNIEEVFVVAKYRPEVLGESERYAQGVVDTMGIGELSRFGGSDIAQSVFRVPSVTVKDGRFVFIRGLGGRYITTTLNGSTLPSTDPAKRTIPLDLFPTNFVNQVDVKKTFVASMPGESTGGNLVINTRTFPASAEGKLSVQTGLTEGLTGRTVLSDPIGGDYDVFGVDDGSRTKASTFRAISDTLDFQDFYPPIVAQELGRVGAILLKDNLDPNTTTATPKVVLGASYGNVYNLDWNSAEFGYFIGGNYRNDWKQRVDGVERTYGGLDCSGDPDCTDDVELKDDFNFEESTNDIDASGILNLGLTVGNSSYGSNTLVSRVTQSRVKQKIGIDGDEGEESIRNTIEWVERQFLSQQITGNHVLGDNENWIADWQLTASRAERSAPDRREVRFDLTGSDEIYNLEVPNILRRYDDLLDDNYDLSTDIEYMFDSDSDNEASLSFGAQAIKRERDSDSESYGFTGGQLLNDNAANIRVADVVNLNSITGNASTGYTFQDKTLASDSYDADLDLNSVYLSYDLLIGAKYQIVTGARYEDFRQTTDTFSLQGGSLQGTTDPVQSVLEDSVLLPTLSFNWFLTEEQTLRFGVSKTVSRPDFKETSNATFYDPDFDIRIRGNPNLQVSDALNLDTRYQYFWNDVDSWSVGLFYKDLDKPIERVVQPASGTAGNSRTFQNAESATVYGLELEARKEFPIRESLTRSFFLSGNLSLIESEVDLLNGRSRALQGQPSHIVNFIVGYDDIENNQELTLLVNQTGETIVDVGVSGQPDILLEPRFDLSLNYTWYFTDNWEFILKGENLLDAEVEFTQGGRDYQTYKTGRQYTVGLNWNF